MYYKYLHHDLPLYLQNWRIMFKHEVHSHDTRDKNKIYTYKVKHAFAQKCLRHSLPLLLNNLPEIVKKNLSHIVHRDLPSMLNCIFFTKLSSSMYYTRLLCMYATLRIKNHLPTLCCMYTYISTYLYLYLLIYLIKMVP